MTELPREPLKRPDALTIGIWIFVVLEAIGIGWFIVTTLNRGNS
jgi:hypothetical protein